MAGFNSTKFLRGYLADPATMRSLLSAYGLTSLCPTRPKNGGVARLSRVRGYRSCSAF